VRLLDAATGKELLTQFQGHDSRVSSLAYSTNGKTLASTVEFGPFLVWNKPAINGSALSREKPGPWRFRPTENISLPPIILTQNSDLDVAAGSEAQAITVPDSAFNSLAVFSSDGQKVYTLNRNSHDEERRYFLRHWTWRTGSRNKRGPSARDLAAIRQPRRQTVFGELDAGGKISVYAVESGRNVSSAPRENTEIFPSSLPPTPECLLRNVGTKVGCPLWMSSPAKRFIASKDTRAQ